MMISMRRLTSAWNSYVSSPSRFWRALPRKAFRQPGRLQEGQRRDGHALRIFAVVGLEADYSLRELGQTGCMHRQMASRHNGRRRRVHRSACLGANCQRQRDKYTEHRRTYVYDPLQGCSLERSSRAARHPVFVEEIYRQIAIDFDAFNGEKTKNCELQRLMVESKPKLR